MRCRFLLSSISFFSLECSTLLQPPVDTAKFTPIAARQHRVVKPPSNHVRFFIPVSLWWADYKTRVNLILGPEPERGDNLCWRGRQPHVFISKLSSVFYLRGDCGLAGSQNHLEFNISNHSNTSEGEPGLGRVCGGNQNLHTPLSSQSKPQKFPHGRHLPLCPPGHCLSIR